jgi:hypothetical protein
MALESQGHRELDLPWTANRLGDLAQTTRAVIEVPRRERSGPIVGSGRTAPGPGIGLMDDIWGYWLKARF